MKLASKFKTATVLGAVCAAFAVPAHAELTGSAGLAVHVWDGGTRDTDAPGYAGRSGRSPQSTLKPITSTSRVSKPAASSSRPTPTA